MTEPWMRGYLEGTDPVLAAILYSLQGAREDMSSCLSSLSEEQVWKAIGKVAPVGFHARHAAGSIDRLITYASGDSLSEDQFEALRSEHDRGLTSAQLMDLLERSLTRAETVVKSVDPAHFPQRRELGRKRIPTTLGGLLIHIAEHTQRHVGAALVTAKLVSLPLLP